MNRTPIEGVSKGDDFEPDPIGFDRFSVGWLIEPLWVDGLSDGWLNPTPIGLITFLLDG